MRLRDELFDPMGVLFAAIAGGVAAAATMPFLPAVGVGAAVYAVKVVTGLVTNREPSLPGPRNLPVTPHSHEEAWLRRAQDAVRSFGEVAESVGHGPIREHVTTFGTEVREALASIRRLAGQASAVGSAILRIDARRVKAEISQLTAAISKGSSGRVRREQERAVAALRLQLDSHARLAEAREALIAQIEAGTIGLEGLVARLAEVVVLVETTDVEVHEIDELAAELDGLRAGLVEAENLTAHLGDVKLPDAGTVSGERSDPPR